METPACPLACGSTASTRACPVRGAAGEGRVLLRARRLCFTGALGCTKHHLVSAGALLASHPCSNVNDLCLPPAPPSRPPIKGGERLVKPEEYRSRLALPSTRDAGNSFMTYTINWQPDRVVWSAEGAPLLRRNWGDNVTWTDMRGQAYRREYRAPVAPQHVTFSMWADQDQNRAFGGRIDWAKSPFYSHFRDLRWGWGGREGGSYPSKRVVKQQRLPAEVHAHPFLLSGRYLRLLATQLCFCSSHPQPGSPSTAPHFPSRQARAVRPAAGQGPGARMALCRGAGQARCHGWRPQRDWGSWCRGRARQQQRCPVPPDQACTR
jgi:hypothetical protein